MEQMVLALIHIFSFTHQVLPLLVREKMIKTHGDGYEKEGF